MSFTERMFFLTSILTEFTERMFFLTSILTEDRDIAEVIKASIVIIFLNADLLNIDLLWHIEQKMKYNELRENKHGKRY